MPMYEYRCESCGEQLEKMQRISADPLTTCPECGEEALKRLISQTSFVLKGTGWYATDYAGKGKGSATSGDKADAGGGADKDASKADSPSSTDSGTKDAGSADSTSAKKKSSGGSADAA